MGPGSTAWNAVLAVTVLVVLAGCTFAGSETRTPYDVPERTVDGESVATGTPHWIRDDGHLDPSRVLRIHVGNLANEPVTVSDRRRREYENGTTRSESTTISEYGPNSRVHVVQTVTEPSPSGSNPRTQIRREYWGNQSLGVAVVASDEGTSYRPGAPGDAVRTDYRRLFQWLRVLDPKVVDERSVSGHTIYVATATVPDPPDDVVADDLRDPRNLSMVVRVRDDGILRSYRLEYTATRSPNGVSENGTIPKPASNATIAVVEERSFGGIGTTKARAPHWVSEAIAEICGEEPNPCQRGAGWPPA